jgi:hypothetical protein
MHDDCTSKRPCQEAVSWRAASSVTDQMFAATRHTQPEPGEIWTVRETRAAGGEQALLAVVIAADAANAAIVPLSDEPRHATEWDLRIPRGILGYPVIAQVKLAGKITASQLDQRLSSLPAGTLDQLRQLNSAAQDRHSLPPEHLPVGPWVLSEADKRLRIRRDQAQRLSAYLTPCSPDPTEEWHSFGAILARGALASGRALHTLLDDNSAAEKLQHNQMDLFSELPARRLAVLLSKLGVTWTEAVRDALYQLVFDRYHPVEPMQGATLARRRGRRSKGTRASGASDSERKDAAEKYVHEVEQRLRQP